MREDLFLQLDQFFHLLDEPGLDMRSLVQRFDVGPLPQGFVHQELTLARRVRKLVQEFL